MKKVSEVGGYGLYLSRGTSWVLRWSERGEQRSRTVGKGTQAEAEAAARMLIREIADPARAIITQGDDPTFSEIWLAYEQSKRRAVHARDLTPERFRLIMYRLEKYYRPHLFKLPLSRLEAGLLAIDQTMRASGLSPQTIDDVIKSARECWSMAHDAGTTRIAPPRRYRTPGFQPPSERRPKGRYLGLDEIGRIIDASAEGHVRDMLMIEIGTGARTGQIADLRAHQVRLDLGVIIFDDLEKPRNAKRRPISAISGPLWRTLDRLVAGAMPSGHLIHYRGKAVAEGSRNFYQTIARICARAGVGPEGGLPVNRYSIRRTFADTIAAHVPGAALSQAMGHASIGRREMRRIFESMSPTTEIYTRGRLAPVHQVGEALEKIWWPAIQEHTEAHLGTPRPGYHAEALRQANQGPGS